MDATIAKKIGCKKMSKGRKPMKSGNMLISNVANIVHISRFSIEMAF